MLLNLTQARKVSAVHALQWRSRNSVVGIQWCIADILAFSVRCVLDDGRRLLDGVYEYIVGIARRPGEVEIERTQSAGAVGWVRGVIAEGEDVV